MPITVRVISGNVLTGQNVGMEGFLRWPYRQVTVIPEGDDVDEFLGWANAGAGKMSVKRSFIGHFLSGKKFNPDARIRRVAVETYGFCRVSMTVCCRWISSVNIWSRL